MSISKIEGIVLESIDFDNFAKIIKVFSKQLGILSIFAPGVNKENSKNKYAIQNLSLSQFEIFKSRRKDKISKLKTGYLQEHHFEITKNYNNYIYVSIIINLLTQLEPSEKRNNKIYNAFKEVLNNIKNKHNSFINYILFLLFFIQNSEYKLRLDICGRCEKKSPSYKRFEYKEKILICNKCLFLGENIQPKSFLKILSTIDNHIFSFLVNQHYLTSDLVIINNFLIDYISSELGVFIGALYIIKNNASMKLNEKTLALYY